MSSERWTFYWCSGCSEEFAVDAELDEGLYLDSMVCPYCRHGEWTCRGTIEVVIARTGGGRVVSSPAR